MRGITQDPCRVSQTLLGRRPQYAAGAAGAALQCALIVHGIHVAMLPDSASLLLLVTREMPFGKHKGTLIADLPGNYLNWFAREGFPPGEIGRLLALMHELDHNGLSDLLRPLREKAPRR